MSRARVSKAVLGVAALMVLTASVLSWLRLQRVERTPVYGPKLIAAVDAYRRAHRQGPGERNATVSLDSLVSEGYVAAEDVRGFHGARVTFFRDSGETFPEAVLVEAAFADGMKVVVLGDGSVQQRR